MEYGAKLYRRITFHRLGIEYDTKLYRLIIKVRESFPSRPYYSNDSHKTDTMRIARNTQTDFVSTRTAE